MLITFSGIDGAGKSTQIEKLRQYLDNQGRRVIYLWSRGGYTPGFEFLKKTLRLFLGRGLPASGDVKGRTVYFKKGLVRRFWIWIALVDLMRVYAVSIRLQLLFGRAVICDRYVWDTLIDLKILFPQENVERWVLWRLLKFLSPKPSASFLLFVPYNVSRKRSAAKGERHVEPEKDLLTRYALYKGLIQQSHFNVIDGTRPFEEGSSHIMKVVGKEI